MNILKGLEPAPVFRHFEALCAIPHGSRNTKAISDHCAEFAKEQGLKYLQDEYNNVIIWKAGTPGYENAAPVMIQGHLDMVAEKEADCPIDMEREGLRLQVKDGIISAQGTTLGGDDGIAVAYALALLEAKDIPHPPLEVVLTVDEEIGMLGAEAMDMSVLKSRTMLNLDSEEEGYLLVSCAGGLTPVCHLPIEREECSGTALTLEVRGCMGGHSGAEIDKGRANANLLLGRTLYALRRSFPVHITSVEGGSKDNAIPRSAKAELVLESEEEFTDLLEEVVRLEETYQKEYALTDPGITLHCTETGKASRALTQESAQKLVTALMNLPAGIQRMSFSMPGMVQTSLNLGILRTEEKEVVLSYCVRSSVESEKRHLTDQLRCLMEQLGGSVEELGDYPGWEYRQESPLREKMIEVYTRLYGKAPVVQSMHAGVECGFFAGRLPGLDCVSFGPNLRDIHTPQESMEAESVRRTWEYLLEVLKELN